VLIFISWLPPTARDMGMAGAHGKRRLDLGERAITSLMP